MYRKSWQIHTNFYYLNDYTSINFEEFANLNHNDMTYPEVRTVAAWL